MKIKFLMTGLLGVITTVAFAQKAELTTAQTEYAKYESLHREKTMAKLAETSLKTAKVSIDKAVVNEKTAVMPLTWALKASIYAAYAFNDTVAATSTPNFIAAEEALKKAKELDTKGENKKMIDNAYSDLGQYQLNKGIKEYGAKKYDLAYKSFDYYRSVMPEDTTAIYYTALAAANSQNYDAAITNYNKLLTTNFSNKLRLYQDLSGFYLFKKDTTGAIKILNEASTKFPNEATFNRSLIELNLQKGNKDEVLKNIENAIAKDPKNKVLYYYAGITYTHVAEDANKKLAALTKTPAKAAPVKTPAKPAAPVAAPAVDPQAAALEKTRDEYLDKAEKVYRAALAIDPNYFEANLNLGYVIMSPGIDLYNAANQFPVSKQKEYNAAMLKANAMFELAKPFLQKAVDLQPNNINALNNLKNYFIGKKDMTQANEIKKKIEALEASGAK